MNLYVSFNIGYTATTKQVVKVVNIQPSMYTWKPTVAADTSIIMEAEVDMVAVHKAWEEADRPDYLDCANYKNNQFHQHND